MRFNNRFSELVNSIPSAYRFRSYTRPANELKHFFYADTGVFIRNPEIAFCFFSMENISSVEKAIHQVQSSFLYHESFVLEMDTLFKELFPRSNILILQFFVQTYVFYSPRIISAMTVIPFVYILLHEIRQNRKGHR